MHQDLKQIVTQINYIIIALLFQIGFSDLIKFIRKLLCEMKIKEVQ